MTGPGRGRNMAAMARVRITCWRDIPVLVTARDDAREVTVTLGQAVPLELGLGFAVREGGHTVAAGAVAEIVE